LVVGLLVTFSAVAVLPEPRGVYWTKADLIFLAPTKITGNPLSADFDSVVYFAAAVEREFNRRPAEARVASSTATLYGRGVREGFEVTLPSIGTQWQPVFDRPKLTVEVVDTTEAKARQDLYRIVNDLKTIVRDRQVAAGVDVRLMIRTSLTPSQPVITYVTGSHTRERAAVFLLGLSMSLALAVFSADRRRRIGLSHQARSSAK
jgi:hypothetical protein